MKRILKIATVLVMCLLCSTQAWSQHGQDYDKFTEGGFEYQVITPAFGGKVEVVVSLQHNAGEELVYPDSVKYERKFLKITAVEGCDDENYYKNVKKATLPSHARSVGWNVFQNATNLIEVNLPKTLESIGQRAFAGCRNLKSIVLPESLTEIGNHAFYGCTQLSNVNLPQALSTIEDFAFYGCTQLSNVNLPQELSSIGDFAFGRCSSLTDVVLPAKLSKLGAGVFGGCRGLTSITVAPGNKKFQSPGGSNAVLDRTGTTLVTACNVTKIPSSVKIIGGYAFSDCTGLTTIELPSELEVIKSYAFSDCTNLQSIDIPAGVGRIGEGAFKHCIYNHRTTKTNQKYPSVNL